jgi:hypothetical protein
MKLRQPSLTGAAILILIAALVVVTVWLDLSPSIDVGSATLLAAVIVLIGTFAANTITTILQERSQRKAQEARALRLHKALYNEMGFIVARFCNIIINPSSTTGALDGLLSQAADFEVYKSIHKDTALFYGLENAEKIDHFYKWVSIALDFGKGFCSEWVSERDKKSEANAVLGITEILKRYLQIALKTVDIVELMGVTTHVWLSEDKPGEDPRECIKKIFERSLNS